MRYFHNLFGQFQLNKKLALITGFDIGAQQTAKGSKAYNAWYSPAVIVKYAATDKVSVSARGEYYHDAKGVIINSGTPNGFQTYGYSLNVDYNVADNVVWRIEGRGFTSKDKVFTLDDKQAGIQNYSLTTALAISF